MRKGRKGHKECDTYVPSLDMEWWFHRCLHISKLTICYTLCIVYDMSVTTQFLKKAFQKLDSLRVGLMIFALIKLICTSG